MRTRGASTSYGFSMTSASTSSDRPSKLGHITGDLSEVADGPLAPRHVAAGRHHAAALSPDAARCGAFPGATSALARNDQEIFEKVPDSSIHGVTERPSSTTGVSGEPFSFSGGTG